MALEINAKFGTNGTLEVSMTVWKAGIIEKGVSLYLHIADMAGNLWVTLWVPDTNVIYGHICWRQDGHARDYDPNSGGIQCPRSYGHWSSGLPQPEECHQEEIWKEFTREWIHQGRFSLNIRENIEASELLKFTIENTNYNDQGVVHMDMAASEFLRSDK